MVSMYLGLEPNDILDGVADDDGHVELLGAMLDKTGHRCCLFFYQDGPVFPIGLDAHQIALGPCQNYV